MLSTSFSIRARKRNTSLKRSGGGILTILFIVLLSGIPDDRPEDNVRNPSTHRRRGGVRFASGPPLQPRDGRRTGRSGAALRLRLCGDASGQRARHTRAVVGAVAVRILIQVLLVVVLGEEERSGGRDLGRD